MKIAFLIDQYSGPNAGTERQMLLLSQLLQAAGHDVALVVFQHTPYTLDGAFPAPVICLNIGRVISPASWWRVYRWAKTARQGGLDIVQIFFNDPALFVPLCLEKAGLPCLVSRRDMGFWYTPLRLLLLRVMRAYVQAMVANSEAVAAFCGEAEGYPVARRVVIYNAIEPKVIPTEERADAPPVIGLVANIRPIKRIADVIAAVGQLRRKGIDTQLRIVGGGDPDDLVQLAESLDISDCVEFTGASNDVSAELRTMDIGVLCSESEGLSNAIMEYMQAELPVVATDTGGNAELVTDGEGGFLYSVGDVKALSEQLETLICAPERRRAMGAFNAQLINQRFSPEVVARQYIELYRRYSGQGHRAALARKNIKGRQR